MKSANLLLLTTLTLAAAAPSTGGGGPNPWKPKGWHPKPWKPKHHVPSPHWPSKVPHPPGYPTKTSAMPSATALPLVDSEALQGSITEEGLAAKAQQLEVSHLLLPHGRAADLVGIGHRLRHPQP